MIYSRPAMLHRANGSDDAEPYWIRLKVYPRSFIKFQLPPLHLCSILLGLSLPFQLNWWCVDVICKPLVSDCLCMRCRHSSQSLGNPAFIYIIKEFNNIIFVMERLPRNTERQQGLTSFSGCSFTTTHGTYWWGGTRWSVSWAFCSISCIPFIW